MNNLPLDIIYYKIIPFNSTTEDLQSLKLVNKMLSDYIIVHPSIEDRECSNCKKNRYRVVGRKRCFIKGCMSKDLFHPYDNIKNKKGLSFCSQNCSLYYNYKLF
jgi:hypothetical protein